MDFSPEQMAINGAASLVLMGGYKLLSKVSRKKQVLGLCVIKGKSRLCKELSGDQKHFFVDIDQYCEMIDKENYDRLKGDASQFMLFFYPKISAYVDNLVKSFSNKVLILVSAKFEMLKQLGVKTRVFCPTSELLNKLPSLDEKQKASLNCLNMLLASNAKKYKVFNSFEELYKLVRDKFDVRNVLNV